MAMMMRILSLQQRRKNKARRRDAEANEKKKEQGTKAHQKEGRKNGFFFNALNWFIYNHKYIYIYIFIYKLIQIFVNHYFRNKNL